MTKGKRHRLACAARGAALLAAIVARDAQAHPIHTTITRVVPFGDSATITVRAFADDFSMAVARFAGRPAPADHSAPEPDASRYVVSRLRLSDRGRRPVALRPCGVKREGALYWICLRAPWHEGGRGVVMHNELLGDVHADQVNVVQVEEAAARRVVLFTPGSAGKPIGR